MDINIAVIVVLIILNGYLYKSRKDDLVALAECQKKLANMQSDLQNVQTDVAKATANVASLTKELADANVQSSNLQNQLAIRIGQYGSCLAASSTDQAIIAGLQNQIATVSNNVATLQTQLVTNTAMLATFQQRMNFWIAVRAYNTYINNMYTTAYNTVKQTMCPIAASNSPNYASQVAAAQSLSNYMQQITGTAEAQALQQLSLIHI